jgi:HSP20 family protein
MLPVLFNGTRLDSLFSSLPFTRFQGEAEEAYFPAYDVDETEKGYEIVLDLSGVAREDVKASIEGTTLTIKGSRKAPDAAPEGKYSHRTRWSGEFSRSFDLGEDADGSKVAASLKDGVLRLTIGKAESAKPREIAIQS